MNYNEHIDNYLAGTATESEVAELLTWVNESAENKKEFDAACQLWHSLNSTNFDSENAYKEFCQKTARKKLTIIPLWQKISAVAAVAILTIGCFTIFQKHDVQTITVTNTEMAVQVVTLPDSSTIFLPKGSSVSYPETFEKTERNITTTGNVFCEVIHNESKPFFVTNEELTIQVLGTSFQINTIENTNVVVETGKVKVTIDNQSVIISKGERVDYSNNTLIPSVNTDKNYLSWKTGKLRFQNAKLQQVFDDLNRHYNCNIIIENNSNLLNYNYTGAFDNVSLEETLQTIELSIPEVHFSILDNKILVSCSKE